MTKHDKKINILFIYWLGLSLILVFSIIVVGGLTRLTDSGLSITEWELFSGILPPLNNNDWENYFNLYKKIPQFNFLNSDMTLQEFKVIFYWEYFHRILARFIGLFFLIPLIYFYFSGKISKVYLTYCLIIFSLILLQGFIGWYMVQSGLTSDVTVSHYRLSIHLSIALIIISVMFWLYLNFKNKTCKHFFNLSKKNLPFIILFLLIFIQIILGAFVSGLDAGKIYQTWPLMGNSYLPNDLITEDINSFFKFNDHSLVQFYHRNLAYVVSLYVLVMCYLILKKRDEKLYLPVSLLLIFLSLQVFLGIVTLLSGINIVLASSHQIGSVLLIFSAINLYYFQIK